MDRKRVSTRYNKYLKSDDPFSDVPSSSKKTLTDSNIGISNVKIGVEEYEEVDHTLHTEGDPIISKEHEDDSDPICVRTWEQDEVFNYIELLTHSHETAVTEPSDDTATLEEYSDVFSENLNEDEFHFDEEENSPHLVDDSEEKTEESYTETPIYNGSALTLGASMLLIITFATRHGLTGEALSELLQLINLHCLIPNIIPLTLHKFKQWFQDLKHDNKYHYYCSNCHMLVDKSVEICPICEINLDCTGAKEYFIEVPLKTQLKSLFQRKNFYTSLQSRFRTTRMDNIYSDIHDGEIYQNLFTPAFLKNPHNISFTFNTDGVPVFKSSKMSIWPLYLMINELPFLQRSKQENMILAGLWFSNRKPTFASFFQPFYTSFKNLQCNGVEVTTDGGETFITKGFLICGTCDLPARASVCNMNQYNGGYACIKCLNPGRNVKVGQRGRVQAFLPEEQNILGTARTDEIVAKNGKEAGNVTVVNGIHGPSYLSYINSYSFVKSTGIDYMHGVCLGVMKKLTLLWFSPEYKGEMFCFSKFVEKVDSRLCSVKPPNNITRPPRSFSDHKSYWKASEWKNWMLYYSIPILQDILSDMYLKHYILLSEAMFILLQDCITSSEINRAERLLIEFVIMFPALYDNRYCGLNVHQLLHLPQNVRDSGPLWSYSCFPFESANGFLMGLFHGTQQIDRQIVQALNISQCIPELQKKVLHPGTEAHIFYERMNNEQIRIHDKQLEENIVAISSSYTKPLTRQEYDALSSYLDFVPMKCICFNRVRIGREIYHSNAYKRVSRRNSYTVMYNDTGDPLFGTIRCFLQAFPPCSMGTDCEHFCHCKPVNLAVMNSIQMKKSLSMHIYQIEISDLLVVTRIKNLIRKCVFIDIDGKKYLCKIPNVLEKD